MTTSFVYNNWVIQIHYARSSLSLVDYVDATYRKDTRYRYIYKKAGCIAEDDSAVNELIRSVKALVDLESGTPSR